MIRRKGGRRFPALEDRRYMAWCGVELLAGAPCDLCGGRATIRAHVHPKGRGTHNDLGNIALLCPPCDLRSEKKPTPELEEAAQSHARRYLKGHGTS